MTIVFTARCRRSLGAAPRSLRTTRNTQIIIIVPFENRPVQSSLAPLCSPTHPHHQCRPTTTTHTLKQPPGDLDFGRPSQTPAGSYSYRTVTEPRLIQSQAIQSNPWEARTALGSSMRVCFSTAQLSSSPFSPPARPASPPCPVCTLLSTSSAVSSRLVPCHRPRLFCNLAPIWSCHSIFTALSTPDSVACLLAVLSSHAAVADRTNPPPPPAQAILSVVRKIHPIASATW